MYAIRHGDVSDRSSVVQRPGYADVARGTEEAGMRDLDGAATECAQPQRTRATRATGTAEGDGHQGAGAAHGQGADAGRRVNASVRQEARAGVHAGSAREPGNLHADREDYLGEGRWQREGVLSC